tara:strand:- start:364 stop:582 length:219 start_codon:yes stop_codon:yes gene_type:complete
MSFRCLCECHGLPDSVSNCGTCNNTGILEKENQTMEDVNTANMLPSNQKPFYDESGEPIILTDEQKIKQGII